MTDTPINLDTFIIHLPKNVQRKCDLSSQLKKFPWLQAKFIDAVYGANLSKTDLKKLVSPDINLDFNHQKATLSPGEIGCAASHLALYDTIISQKLPYALILEDDVRFFSTFEPTLQAILQQSILNTTQPIVILLSRPFRYYRQSTHHVADSKLHAIYSAKNADAYLINQAAAKYLVQTLRPIAREADRWTYLKKQGVLKILTCVPHIANQNIHATSDLAGERRALANAKSNVRQQTIKVIKRLGAHSQRMVMFPFFKRYRGPKEFPQQHKVLVIAPGWIGDAVMAESLYQCIKAQRANSHITVLTPLSIAPLYQCISTIDAVITTDFSRGKLDLKQRWKLGKTLRHGQYHVAYVLPNSWKSALIPCFAKIPKRIGWLGEQRYGLLTHKRKLNKTQLPLMVQRYAALAGFNPNNIHPAQYPAPQLKAPSLSQDNNAAITKALAHKKQGRRILALCPGATYGPSKRWPVDYFARLAQYALHQNMTVWLLGGPGDKKICNEINIATQTKCIDLSGQTTLLNAIALLAQADQVIANDSGLLHIASALNQNVIAIYGSTSATKAPPLSPRAHIFSCEDLPCKPCRQRTCPLGHYNCLRQITPEQVIEHIITS